MLLRISIKCFNYKWNLPGGNLNFGEDATNGIIKKIKEGIGLKVKNIKPFDVESRINKNGEFWTTIAYRTKMILIKQL